ncbi:MAG: asparaginase [Chloroflexi bacterium]|nr:asparaginase [Chloroflexota bacterium]MDA1227063.1 asparaginase [Chloroflexota bacterium]
MSESKPRIRIVATGGSIAGLGPDRLDYILYPEVGGHLTIEESLARIPEAGDIADISSEDIVSVGSTAIGPGDWLSLANRINKLFAEDSELAGIVVTHGTATLEETAYFLHLTVKSTRPVVITGAMRPPTALGTDADLNLMDAIRLASSPNAAGLGVLTVLNNEVHCARDVTKSNTYRVDTFRPNELGFLGYVDSDGQVMIYRKPTRAHTVETPFDVSGRETLPRIDIIYAYAGADGMLVDAARNGGSEGLILAGFGGGTFPPAFLEAGVRTANQGLPVVLASRSTAGRVILTPRKAERGFIVSDNLPPQKARILLMLGLTVTESKGEIQDFFYQH